MVTKDQNLLFDGTVDIELGGETLTLRPTVNAALKLSRLYGGISPILSKIPQMEFDVYVNVIRHGLGMSDKEAEGLQEKIFREGMSNLISPLIDYIVLLSNGGKKTSGEGEAEAGKASA